MVETRTRTVREMQKLQVELLMADHLQDCATCIRHGDCELQDLAQFVGLKENRFFDRARTEARPIDDSSPAIIRDMTRCVRCQRCVAVCRYYPAGRCADDVGDRRRPPGRAEGRRQPGLLGLRLLRPVRAGLPDRRARRTRRDREGARLHLRSGHHHRRPVRAGRPRRLRRGVRHAGRHQCAGPRHRRLPQDRRRHRARHQLRRRRRHHGGRHRASRAPEGQSRSRPSPPAARPGSNFAEIHYPDILPMLSLDQVAAAGAVDAGQDLPARKDRRAGREDPGDLDHAVHRQEGRGGASATDDQRHAGDRRGADDARIRAAAEARRASTSRTSNRPSSTTPR